MELPRLPSGLLDTTQGFGLDVEPLERFRDLADDPAAWRRLLRTFDDVEQERLAGSSAARSAAALWTAKEAVVKALGRDRVVGLRDVELRVEDGLLVGRWRGGDAVERCLVSIAYTAEHVFAAAWHVGPEAVDDGR